MLSPKYELYPRSIWESEIFGPSQLTEYDIERLVSIAKKVDMKTYRKRQSLDVQSHDSNCSPKINYDTSNDYFWLYAKRTIKNLLWVNLSWKNQFSCLMLVGCTLVLVIVVCVSHFTGDYIMMKNTQTSVAPNKVFPLYYASTTVPSVSFSNTPTVNTSLRVVFPSVAPLPSNTTIKPISSNINVSMGPSNPDSQHNNSLTPSILPTSRHILASPSSVYLSNRKNKYLR